MKNQLIKKMVIYLVTLGLIIVTLYQGNQIRQMNDSYAALKEAYFAKTDTSFIHGLRQWKSGDEFIQTLESLMEIEKGHDYDEARGLIQKAKIEGAAWSRQLRDLVVFSEAYNPEEEISFFRINHFWLTSQQQMDLYMADKNIELYFIRKISYIHWQNKEIDQESKRVLGELINHIQILDAEVKGLYQQIAKSPYGLMEDQHFYRYRQNFLDTITPSVEAIKELADGYNYYIGENTVISKNDDKQTVQVMMGVTKEELKEKTLEEIVSNKDRQRLDIIVNHDALYQQLKVGDKIAVWYTGKGSSGEVLNASKIEIVE